MIDTIQLIKNEHLNLVAHNVIAIDYQNKFDENNDNSKSIPSYLETVAKNNQIPFVRYYKDNLTHRVWFLTAPMLFIIDMDYRQMNELINKFSQL
ncbi:MAG: hypothetical protein F6K34_01420 [Okeania sp. SIO4D6]|nr:hypothetical protein [Okeania sp. SIO4D6]